MPHEQKPKTEHRVAGEKLYYEVVRTIKERVDADPKSTLVMEQTLALAQVELLMDISDMLQELRPKQWVNDSTHQRGISGVPDHFQE